MPSNSPVTMVTSSRERKGLTFLTDSKTCRAMAKTMNEDGHVDGVDEASM